MSSINRHIANDFRVANVTRPDFYYFYSKDHLGNIRSVVTKNPSTNEITEVQQTHYYPFGGIIADISSGTSVQNKLYNGQGSCKRVERKLAFNFPSAAEAQPKVKEFDRMHGLDWYDYGARWMDASIGRWHSVDPLCEKFYDVSPYVYCKGDPINKFDQDGKFPLVANAIGAVVSAGVEIGTQMAANKIIGKDITDIDYKQVGVAAAEGFLSCGGSAVRRSMVSMGGAVVRAAIDDNTKTNADFTVKTALNAMPSVAGKLGKNLFSKSIQRFAQKVTSNNNTKKVVKNYWGTNSKTASKFARKTENFRKAVAQAARKAPEEVVNTSAGVGADVADKLRDKKK